MKAMVLPEVVSLDDTETPLELVDLPKPRPCAGEVLIEVAACGVCHTDLDEIEGRVVPSKLPVVLGHQVVGRVVARGTGARRHELGERVGVGWIHSSIGGPEENLSPEMVATGCDVDGGYAEYMTVPESYAFRLAEVFSDAQAAPLLCAGAIGYRSLKLTGLQHDQPLGLTGFGASAHLVAQLARYLFPSLRLHVFARDPEARSFAAELGAVWTGDTGDRSPEPLSAIIDTTPAWKPVVEALANLAPGGRLVINAIRKEEGDKRELLRLSYPEHLWLEKQIRSVANITGQDIADFLEIAADVPILPEVETYPLAEANRALLELKRGGVRGAKVLVTR